MTGLRRWQDISPADAVGLDLATDLTITAPLTMDGERCPWPWEPQQLVNVPLGQYHCGHCGEMVMAGVEHPDYAGFDEDYAQWCRRDRLRRRQLSRPYRAAGRHYDEPPWLTPSGPRCGVQWTRHKRRRHAVTAAARRLRLRRAAYPARPVRPLAIRRLMRGSICYLMLHRRAWRLLPRRRRARIYPERLSP